MSDDPIPRFSATQTQALTLALDEIIPPRPDGRLPGAGALGIAADVEEALRKTPPLLEMVVEALDAGTDLPPFVVIHAFGAYYRHARIMEALGLEPRPPHPKGYDMPPNDLSLLDPVRRRGPMWRRVE